MGIKVLLAVLALTVFCVAFYKTDWKQSIFFSGLDYSLYFLADLLSVQLENILVNSEKVYISKPVFLPCLQSWHGSVWFLYCGKYGKGKTIMGSFPVRSG